MLKNRKYIESGEMLSEWMHNWKQHNWLFGVDEEDPFNGDVKLDFRNELDMNKGYIFDMVFTSEHQDPGKKADKSLMIIHYIIEENPDKNHGRFEVRLCFDVTGLTPKEAPRSFRPPYTNGPNDKGQEGSVLMGRRWTFAIEKTRGWKRWGHADVIEQEDDLLDLELVQIMESVGLNNMNTTAYWASNWNKMDFTIVWLSILSLIVTNVKPLKALRAIRPLRLATRSQSVKVVVSTLMSAIGPASSAVIFSLFIFFILSILGINLFNGKFSICMGTDPLGNSINPYLYNKVECNILQHDYNWDCKWWRYPFHYDNIGEAMQANFVLASGDTWHAIMYKGMDAPMVKNGTPQFNNQAYWGLLYFVFVMVLGGFFAFNFIVSAIVDKFIEIKGERDGSAFMTKSQRLAVQTMRIKNKFVLERIPPRPEKPGFRMFCYDIVNAGPKNQRFDRFITMMILLNTFMMCLQHRGIDPTFNFILKIFDYVFVGTFVMEAFLKISANGFIVYWRNNWNKFDFVVVLISMPDIYFDVAKINSNIPGLSVFRVFRIGRILRLIKKARELNLLFQTLLYSFPSLWNVGVLLLISYYIFAIMGMNFFGGVIDQEGRISPRHRNWKDVGHALNLLYIGSTGDSWTTPWQGLMDNTDQFANVGGYATATIYHVFFFLGLGLVMLNLFIGVILEVYDQNNQVNEAEDKMLAVHRFTKLWNKLDHLMVKHLPIEQFMGILKHTPWPIGFAKPLKVEHEDNILKLKKEAHFERTRDRFQRMKKRQQAGAEDPWIDPDVEEVSSHVSKWTVECKYWEIQKVWVVSFEQAVISFAVMLLEYPAEEEPHNSRRVRYIYQHFREEKAELYDCLCEGSKCTRPLGDTFLHEEKDPEDDEEEEVFSEIE